MVSKKALLLLLLFFSCTSNPSPTTSGSGNYSFYILAKDGKDCLVKTDSLSGETIYPEQQGAKLEYSEFDRDIIVKHHFIYHTDRRSGYFSKYHFDRNSYTKVDSIAALSFLIQNACWTGGDTLLLTGLEKPGYARAKYMLLKTDKLQLIAGGYLNLPAPQPPFTSISIGFTDYRKEHILIGYTYHQQKGKTSDTMYVTNLTYPALKAMSTDKDTRSAYPGAVNTVQKTSFEDEAGDFYFMSCPGIALGNRTELPTAVFRIKKGESTVDKGYFFNTSAVIHNHGYGLWYLGNHKAIMRCERKDLFTGLSDHYSKAHFEFYLLDLSTQQVIKKLNLPLDKGTRRECVLVDKGFAWIATNSTLEGNYIWKYDIGKDTLIKVMQLAGNTDFIMRMDPLR
jgi:hypothetical protein